MYQQSMHCWAGPWNNIIRVARLVLLYVPLPESCLCAATRSKIVYLCETGEKGNHKRCPCVFNAPEYIATVVCRCSPALIYCFGRGGAFSLYVHAYTAVYVCTATLHA